MSIKRLHIRISGAVQGVGFRPFLFKLLDSEHLAGNIRNTAEGVNIEAEGKEQNLHSLLLRITSEHPPLARIFSMEPRWLDPVEIKGIEFLPSLDNSNTSKGVILPDIATCPDCLREILTPGERRFGYPFTNCTNCGPRYTIIESLPYDRERTTMKKFPMCRNCIKEYANPADRRFHAQPISCPNCGPSLRACKPNQNTIHCGRDTSAISSILDDAVTCLRHGGIIGLMGIGGVQLIADATNDQAIRELRRRKARDSKPFAVMVRSLEEAKKAAIVSQLEARLLSSPEAPIVLLARQQNNLLSIAPSVCSTSPWIGIMLPSTPLHHLLVRKIDQALVVTSGNLSHEPMCITAEEAFEKLGNIVDLFILHDRPILRPVDDSVVRVVNQRELVIRRARGYAPMPVGSIKHTASPDIFAAGAQLKNALGRYSRNNGQSVLSQHIGDLDDLASIRAWESFLHDSASLFDHHPQIIAVDAHPEYISTQRAKEEARQLGIPCFPVQHHIAHVLACMEENEVPFPCMGVAWDGAGYGENGAIWGGEWFQLEENDWKRIGHLREFPLPGGDAAATNPARIALSLYREIMQQISSEGFPELKKRILQEFDQSDLLAYSQILEKKLNCPMSSSMGRLFDATAFFLGFHGNIRHEGEAAVWLESLAMKYDNRDAIDLPPMRFSIISSPGKPFLVDWEPWLRHLDARLADSASKTRLAWEFHDNLAQIIVTAARLSGTMNIAVGGGCFQNTLLLERLNKHAQTLALNVYSPQRIPVNDGGIALGQISAVIHHYPPFQTHVPGSTR